MNKRLSWRNCGTPAGTEKIMEIQRIIDASLPKSYIECLQECNGGTPEESSFEYFDNYFQEKTWGCIGRFLSADKSSEQSLVFHFKNRPDCFPSELIAFAETGGGDFVCFDYREDPQSLNPPISYWFHEAPQEKSISRIASTFDEFMHKLIKREFDFSDLK